MSLRISEKSFKAINDNIIICDMNFDEQVTKGGIIVKSDDGKSEGIKPRWGKVWAIGPDQTDVKIGEWILVEHGRWTRGIDVELDSGETLTIRRVETTSILAVSDVCPEDISLGSIASPQHPTFDFSDYAR